MTPHAAPEATAFSRLLTTVQASGVTFVLHSHAPTRTMQDAAQTLCFDVARIVKTVAFRRRDGGLVLAALRGTHRVDYAKLAALAGIGRRDLCALAPQEVAASLGVEPGSVSPVPLAPPKDGLAAEIFLDGDVLTIAPTLYCGIGRPDRTLELAPADLARLCGGKTGEFSR